MLKGLGGLGNIAALMKQAQTIGPKMEEVTARLKTQTVSGTAGAGMVTVHADGLGTITKIEIDPVLIEKSDFEMVQDLLPAAINDAVSKAKQLHVEEMQAVTGDLPLPGGMEDALKNFMNPGG